MFCKITIQVQTGFTLFEVLIAVIVLSLGILGISALQLISTRNNFEAMQRTEASFIANAAIERMRANADSMATYAGDDITAAPLGTCPTGSATAIANCDRMELADLMDRSDSLVNGRICITEGANTGEVQVVVAWRGLTEDPVNPSACGTGGADDSYLKQIVINTFIASNL